MSTRTSVERRTMPLLMTMYVSALCLLLAAKAAYKTVQFAAIHPNDPGKAIVASILGELVASLIWVIPIVILLTKKSRTAKWILVVITFPLGLILLTTKVETYLTADRKMHEKADADFLAAAGGAGHGEGVRDRSHR